MSHEIETALYADRPAWHGLGDVLTSDDLATMSVSEIVARAFPGPVGAWEVSCAPITASAFGTDYPVDGKIAVVRNVAPHILGIHGDDYSAESPGARAQLLDNALDGAGTWETMLSLREGKRTVFLKRLGDDIKVGGIDSVGMFAMLADSYDGSLALTCGTTAVRVVCNNTLNMALPEIDARPHIKIKHTKNMTTKVAEIRAAMELSFEWAEGFAVQADKLINTKVTLGRFEEIIRQTFPKAKSDLAPFSREQYAMIGVLQSSPTISKDIRFTGWGALNAVTEYMEHGRGRRNTSGTDDANVSERAMSERRLEDALLSDQKEAANVARLILTGGKR